MALEKSNIEFQEYKESQKLVERGNNLKELETDLNDLKKQLPKVRKRKAQDD